MRTQKENALAVISGEITYLNEHQITVQRKSSELSGKMAEAEASIAAAGHKLQRVEHANEMATADLRRDNEVLTDEARVLASRFEQPPATSASCRTSRGWRSRRRRPPRRPTSRTR